MQQRQGTQGSRSRLPAAARPARVSPGSKRPGPRALARTRPARPPSRGESRAHGAPSPARIAKRHQAASGSTRAAVRPRPRTGSEPRSRARFSTGPADWTVLARRTFARGTDRGLSVPGQPRPAGSSAGTARPGAVRHPEIRPSSIASAPAIRADAASSHHGENPERGVESIGSPAPGGWAAGSDSPPCGFGTACAGGA